MLYDGYHATASMRLLFPPAAARQEVTDAAPHDHDHAFSLLCDVNVT